ncbi:putative toxin [Campylobacter subantarcticus]|uniref:Restriction endonuclease fold toxin 7 family protein n=1 Tax=Campylobacter subantarcticus LMG 24374 TaxID=1388751 RepID=A0A0A8H9L0_9BACT|nr:putative toxin [Campylobacter subantarcticus]AJC90766.1 restriction endonuclease fold toxin 7 family protein [Campylobacter subantarcticus LMG 24374]
MSRVIKINFTDVNFHIKEFQKVYILENCKLYFYSPFHLQTQNGKEVIRVEQNKNKFSFMVKKENELKNKIEEEAIGIDKTSEQNQIKAREEAKDETIKDKEVLFSNDKKGNDAINAYFDKKNINTLNDAYKERKDKPLSRNTESFKDYDIFYDVYTSKDNDIKSLNEELKYNDGFEVKDGIATVKADFFDKCFEEKKYILIPRLVSLEKNETLHFDPVPLEDKGFVVTDFRKGKKDEKNIDLSFQRSIAKIKNPNLTLQSPKEFLQALNDNRDFTEDDKKEQAQAIQEACAKKADEMTKILLKDDESLKDIITDEDKLKEKIEELQKEPKTNEKLSLLGRLEFLQRNQDKVKEHKDMIDQLQNPQQASNSKQNNNAKGATKSRIKNKQKQTTTPNQEEQKNKTINSKDIGDAGEYAASMLFTKRSTRYLSNRRKLDANFNTKGFNHTIPDFLVTLNDYPTLVEVKNVKDQALTEQISFELKLAREYELDYLFLCNHYTKLIDNITNLEIFNKGDEDHKGSRSGFIYHRHTHRSIKTIFKEMYLHHIKGATPNKIMIKRLNLNNPANIEEELNKNKQIQKN